MKEFSDFQRALLGFLLLAELASEPGHGYALAARLERRGFERVKGAKLYPVLSRLESDGYCTATWSEGEGGPGHKIYTISEDGRAYLDAQTAAWERIVPLVHQTVSSQDRRES